MNNEFDIPQQKRDINELNGNGISVGSLPFLNDYLQHTSATSGVLPAYWSKYRDAALVDFVQGNFAAASATQAMVKKVKAMKFKSVPLDPDDDANVQQSKISQQVLDDNWPNVGEQFLSDVFNTDNGGFMLIDGKGAYSTALRPTELVGTGFYTYPTGLTALDSLRVQRTGHATWPLLYQRPKDDKFIKIHRSRAMFFSDAPSSRAKMLGVGFCPISRALEMLELGNAAVNIELESYGDRPMRQIWVGLGWHPKHKEGMSESLNEQYQRSNELGHKHYTRPPLIMINDPDAKMPQAMELNQFPEGYDRARTLDDVFYALALAFDMDISEFWRSGSVGRTAATAEIEDKKSSGKLPAWFLGMMTYNLNKWFAPDNCYFIHDFVDAQEDKLEAEIEGMRISNLSTAVNSGLMSVEVAQQKLAFDYEIITIQQYEEEQQRTEERQAKAEEIAQQQPPEDEETEDDEEDEEVKKSTSGTQFESQLETITEQLVDGEITESDYNDALGALIAGFGLRAFQEGSNTVTPTAEQQAVIDAETQSMIENGTITASIIAALALARAEQRKAINSIFNNQIPKYVNNIEWFNQLGIVNNLALGLLQWRITVGKDNCTTCLGFNGQMKTGQQWQDGGLLPRSRGLACKGYHCGCGLVAV